MVATLAYPESAGWSRPPVYSFAGSRLSLSATGSLLHHRFLPQTQGLIVADILAEGDEAVKGRDALCSLTATLPTFWSFQSSRTLVAEPRHLSVFSLLRLSLPLGALQAKLLGLSLRSGTAHVACARGSTS